MCLDEEPFSLKNNLSKAVLEHYKQVTFQPSLGCTKEIKLFYPPAENMFFLDASGFYNSCQPFLITFNTDTSTVSNALINGKESHTTTAL